METKPTDKKLTVSVILPCRNEEKALGLCLENIKKIFEKNNLDGEIIVSDSSSDGSTQIAENLADKIIKHNMIGYGTAYRESFPHASGEYVFMADADGTYDFEEIPRFIEELKNGSDLIIGNRFGGKIHPGAMPWHHKHIGNPLLSYIFRKLFKLPITDINCGMRATRLETLLELDLKTTGMEFATEMLYEAGRQKKEIKELSINYHPRLGYSKLRTFSDAGRHIFFMLKNMKI